MIVPSLSVMTPLYVAFLPRFFVLRLKIHCLSVGSQRNVVSGVVEMTVSSTVSAPFAYRNTWKLTTRPGVPTETPFISHTQNFVGTVLPCLKTLVLSALIGCKIRCPTSPLQVAPVRYTT